MTKNVAKRKTADGSLPPLEQIQEAFHRVKRSRFYGQQFEGQSLATWEDFFSLPLTTKTDLRRCNPEDTLAVPLTDVWHYHESFGTTGKRSMVVYQAHAVPNISVPKWIQKAAEQGLLFLLPLESSKP